MMVMPSLHCCTFREAQNLGAFISELLLPLNNYPDEPKLKQDLLQLLPPKSTSSTSDLK